MQQRDGAVLHHSLGIKRFGQAQLLSSLLIGSAGTLILGLQPVLLGALLAEQRVTFDGLALIATVEMLAIGIGSAGFALLFAARRMRAKTGLLLIGAALGHYFTAGAPDFGSLALVRGLTGLMEGGLIAIAVEAVARTEAPGRNGGWFVVVQTIAQSILAAILALAVVPKWGSAGGFIVLGIVTIAALTCVALLADDYGPLPRTKTDEPNAAGRLKPAIALGVIFSLYLFIGAIWAFLEPLGGQSGIDAPTVGVIVAVSLLVQVAGALSATALEPHLRYPAVLGGAAVLALLIATGFGLAPGLALFWFLSLATGFLWLFVVPWQIGMTIAADPSRKSVLLVPAAQLFGAAIGPAGAALFISATDFHPAAWFAAAAAALSFALLVLLVALESRIDRGRS